MTTIRERRWPLLLASLLALGLGACGGGGGGNGNDGGGDGSPSPGALTGVFVDAPVSGLAYACGDDEGVTTAAGQFRYDAGDTCTFRAGALSLGQVLAQATLTPREIASAIAQQAPEGTAQSLETITQNLYQLLQSLDSDGDTSNGISLPANLASVSFDAALTDPVTLFNRTPQDFQAQVAAVVTAVVDELAIPLEVVSVEAALEHAAEQSRALLSGTWNIGVGGAGPVAITFFPNGTYLFGGKSDDEVCVTDVPGANVDENGNGAEYGRYAFDPLSGALTTQVISDSTGTCGFSGYDGVSAHATLQVVGDRLRLHTYDTDDAADCVDEGGVDATDLAGERVCRYELTRALGTVAPGAVLGTTRGLEGSYVLESDLLLGIASVVTIERTGNNAYRYLLTESYGNNNQPDEEGATDGISLGTFTVGAGNVVTIDETYNTIDGDGGLGAQPAGLKLSLDADRNLVFDDEDSEPYRFVRLPLRPRIVQSQIVGTFFPREPEQGGLDTQATEPFPAFLSIFDNGEYLLGTYEDDAECQADSNPETTQPHCDGIEYGRFALDVLSGELRLRTDREPNDPRYVDSNGIGGLVDDGNAATSDRFFLRPLAADGEILLLGYRAQDLADPEDEVLAQVAQVNSVAQATAFAAADPDARFFLVLRPVVSTSASLDGAWQLTSVAPSNPALVRADGRIAPFVLVFQNSDEYFLSQTSAALTYDGIEFGNFELRENGTRLCITGTTVDTLAESGLAPASPAAGAPSGCVDYFALAIDGDAATVTTLDAEPVTLGFTRISKPSLAATP